MHSAQCFICAKSLPMKSNAECWKCFPYLHPATLFIFNLVSQQAGTCYEWDTIGSDEITMKFVSFSTERWKFTNVKYALHWNIVMMTMIVRSSSHISIRKNFLPFQYFLHAGEWECCQFYFVIVNKRMLIAYISPRYKFIHDCC